MRPSRDEWAMSLVRDTAKRSTCCRRNVGCVILDKHGDVMSTGFNGVHRGAPHCNEVVRVLNPKLFADGLRIRPTEHWETEYVDNYPNSCPGAFSPSGTNLDGCRAIHAEQNAIMRCKDIYSINKIYISASPCMTCVKLLLNTSGEYIIFDEEYPHAEAKAMWESAGRHWIKFSDLQSP